MRIEFTRTKGAKDLKKRRRAGSGEELKQLESGSRSIANLGRGLNSLSNIVREARITAKYLGVNPTAKAALNQRVGLLHRVRGAREGVDLLNATSRTGINLRRLLL